MKNRIIDVQNVKITISKEEMVFDINEKIKVKFEPEYLFTFKGE